jgi:hypothetical protein
MAARASLAASPLADFAASAAGASQAVSAAAACRRAFQAAVADTSPAVVVTSRVEAAIQVEATPAVVIPVADTGAADHDQTICFICRFA